MTLRKTMKKTQVWNRSIWYRARKTIGKIKKLCGIQKTSVAESKS